MPATGDIENRTLVIGCGALAREIVMLQKQLGLAREQFTLQCLPAEYHNTPSRIAPAVEEILEKRASEFDNLFVAYGECGTAGALDKVLAKFGAERLPHAHCYEFFAGAVLFEKITDEEIGSFFLTDYLVRNFERLVIKGLGLDKRPHLREAYFRNYKQVVYLAQTNDPKLLDQAKAASERLGLGFVYIHVGLGDLETALASAVGATEGAHV